MAQDRAAVRTAAFVQRPAVATTIQRRSASTAPSLGRVLQQRLGNRGTQALVDRTSSASRAAETLAPSTAENADSQGISARSQRSAVSVGFASTVRQATTTHSAGQRQPPNSIQAKLTISQPGDAHEREADGVAEAVMRMPEPSSKPSNGSLAMGVSPGAAVSQRRCSVCEEEGKGVKVQRKEDASAARVTPSVAAGIVALKGGGSPLPAGTRAFFEPRFGADFGRVRVHTGSEAADTASAISARAFTVGRDIAFNAGQYAPHSRGGQRLLAHELTHVVQQTGAQGEAGGGTVMRAPFPPFMRGAPPPGPAPPKKPDPSAAAVKAAATEVVELKGHSTFDPSPALAEMIDWWSPGSLSVRVRFGTLASGRVDIRKRDTGYVSTEDPAMISLHHPAFPGGGYFAPPRMQLSVVDGVVKGQVQFFPWDRVPYGAFPTWTEAFPLGRLLGWKGIDKIRWSSFNNEVKDGVLRYSLDNFSYRLDKEWEGVGNFSVTDDQVTFSAETDIKVPGVADAKMPLEWTAGNVFGSAKLSLTLAPKDILGGKFSGSLEGSFVNGVTNITGEATYTSQKVNGTVTIRVAPVQEAWAQLATHQLPGPGQITALTGPNTTHAVFGWGVLDFHFNEWLSGRASVIVDPAGFITTYGYIRPTKEWSFLEGDEYGVRKLLGKAGPASAFRPVWFTTGLTGTISGELWAAGRIGPLTIHDLELSGVYSTNPTVPFNLALSGVIDVSAIGRMELKLIGSLAYTLLGKHVKTVTITVEVTGMGTLKAYGLLKPTISVEKAKDGDAKFRMKTTLKLAAGLYLGLQGSIKASLPIIGGPKFTSNKYQWFIKGIGLKSELDYLLGDAKGPDLSFEPYAFDPKEFRDKAEDLLDNAAEKYDKQKQETKAPLEDQTTRKPEAPLPPPKVVLFNMNGAQHKLWIEADPEPTLIMETRREPLKKKLRLESTQLKKEESTATGSQKALIKAEETAIAALNKQATDVETSAASLEKRQGDVAGLQELARQIGLYSRQFTKTDIGDRTADLDSDEAQLLPGEGLVGTYGELGKAGSKGDNVTPHHMPQDKYMAEKLKGNPGGETWVYSEGVCINMYHPVPKPKKGRHFFTRSYGAFGNPPRFHETPMEALQKDIANVRAIYQKDKLLNSRIENALARLHALNVKNYPKLFRGGA